MRRHLAAYLDHRRRHWPTTANLHLFLHFRTPPPTRTSATAGSTCALGAHLTCRALRNDRLLDEPFATDGDLKRLTDPFGISTRTAQRFTTSVEHPDLRDRSPGPIGHSR